MAAVSDWEGVVALATAERAALQRARYLEPRVDVIERAARAATLALEAQRLDAAAAILDAVYGSGASERQLLPNVDIAMALVASDPELALAHLVLRPPFLLPNEHRRLCELLCDEVTRALVANRSTRHLGFVSTRLRTRVCSHDDAINVMKMCMTRGSDETFDVCALELAEDLFAPERADATLVEWVTAAARRRFEETGDPSLRLRALRVLAMIARAEGSDVTPYVDRLQREWAARPHLLEALRREVM